MTPGWWVEEAAASLPTRATRVPLWPQLFQPPGSWPPLQSPIRKLEEGADRAASSQ